MLSKLRFPEKTFPWALLVTCLLAFGVFLPWLGFYWDDWPVILMSKFFGVNAFAEFYKYDRPFSAWTYIVTTPLLGLSPLAWQIFALLLRWLTGLFYWLTLRRLWPNRVREPAWVAVLFLIYPVFTLQFISVAFSQHWICALLYAFSLWAMLRALAPSRMSWLWLTLSLAASALQLWTMEYFLGMEIFRYVVLWLALNSDDPRANPASGDSEKGRLRSFLRLAWPYALVLISYIIWRLFIYHPPLDDPNPVRFLQDLRTQPVTGLLTIGQIIVRDLIYMLLQIWAEILAPARVEFTSKFFLFAASFSILTAGLIGFYLSRLQLPESGKKTSRSWPSQALWVGLLGVLLGALPGWLTYRQVLTQPYGNRISLPALFGLALLMVALLEWLSSNHPRRKLLVFSVLCGVSVYAHLFVADYYRSAWESQKNFYWQLAWRVLELAPGTALLSDSEVVPAAGSYSTASAINLIYADKFPVGEFPYWFFNMSQSFASQVENLKAGKNLRQNFRTWRFRGDSENILLVDYNGTSCLRLFQPADPLNESLNPVLKQALPNINLSRIEAGASHPRTPPAIIFGLEPAHNWCYYYQKANLARQQADWKQVIALGKEAEKLGLQPADASEWLPFADAYVQVGDLQSAIILTDKIKTRDRRLLPLLCQSWQSHPEILETLSCSP